MTNSTPHRSSPRHIMTQTDGPPDDHINIDSESESSVETSRLLSKSNREYISGVKAKVAKELDNNGGCLEEDEHEENDKTWMRVLLAIFIPFLGIGITLSLFLSDSLFSSSLSPLPSFHLIIYIFCHSGFQSNVIPQQCVKFFGESSISITTTADGIAAFCAFLAAPITGIMR